MKIELTDVNSGEVEVIEEDNMLTNALTEILKPLGLAKDPTIFYNTLQPFYQTILGGILLFDKAIPEDPDQLFAPGDTNLVGCAVYNAQNNTTSLMRGDYNRTESEYNIENRYMKYVYDFGTAQANGAIECVCLTDAIGGYESYGSEDAVTGDISGVRKIDSGSLKFTSATYTGGAVITKATTITVGISECLFLLSRVHNSMYCFRIDSTSQVTIARRRAHLSAISVLENTYNNKPILEEITLQLDTALLSTVNLTWNFDNDDRCLYITTASATTLTANSTFLITKIEFDTWEVTQHTMTNTTGVTLNTSNRTYAYVHQGGILLMQNASPFTVWELEVGNSANVTPYTLHDTTDTQGMPQYAVNGRVFYEVTGTRVRIVDKSKKEVLRSEWKYLVSSGINTATMIVYATPFLDEPLLLYVDNAGSAITIAGIMQTTNYLATINNLSEPVEKTVDKTMKITYTIQEQ